MGGTDPSSAVCFASYNTPGAGRIYKSARSLALRLHLHTTEKRSQCASDGRHGCPHVTRACAPLFQRWIPISILAFRLTLALLQQRRLHGSLVVCTSRAFSSASGRRHKRRRRVAGALKQALKDQGVQKASTIDQKINSRLLTSKANKKARRCAMRPLVCACPHCTVPLQDSRAHKFKPKQTKRPAGSGSDSDVDSDSDDDTPLPGNSTPTKPIGALPAALPAALLASLPDAPVLPNWPLTQLPACRPT
jgi:hypothetical protein